MTSFAERSRWPRISTAATLSHYLQNVCLKTRGDYQYSADAPCHESKNPGRGDSFHFGDAPGGGLRISCWSCGAGAKMVERIEDGIGRALQVRWPNGSLRYRSNAREIQQLSPATIRGPRASAVVFHASPREGTYTLADLCAEEIWIVGVGKKPWQHEVDGKWCGYRHSLRPRDGGVERARYGGEAIWQPPGGEPVPLNVYPWRSRDRISEQIRVRGPYGHNVRICLSLAGEPGCPHPTDVVIIDLDYSPAADTNNLGAAFRLNLREAFTGLGVPVYGSSSGNGFHAILRMTPDWVEKNRTEGAPTRYPQERNLKVGQSAVAEIFPAGAKRQVVIRFDRPIRSALPDSGTRLPLLSEQTVHTILKDAETKTPA